MSLNEFYKWLERQSIEDKLVHIRYKYSWEDKWTYSNEYLKVNTDSEYIDPVKGCYVWLNDWNEGQEDVEILWCIDVSAIDVPVFKL